jgi:hypothetical protein
VFRRLHRRQRTGHDVIRSLREQQRKFFDLTPELEAWLLEAADKPVTPLTKADFNAVR